MTQNNTSCRLFTFRLLEKTKKILSRGRRYEDFMHAKTIIDIIIHLRLLGQGTTIIGHKHRTKQRLHTHRHHDNYKNEIVKLRLNIV